jgi:uncharacterized protein YgbK (DUF1537 family)
LRAEAPPPRIAYYGDDVTGSTANLAAFHDAGLRAVQFLAVPDAALLARHAQGLDVLGIAGIARSLPTEAMADEVRPAFELFRWLGVRVAQYKLCSTFDSAPHQGSIGRMIELGREVFGRRPVPIAAGDPDFGRWTVFGQHFAQADGIPYRLDRHPTMANHPATPMREADLCRHLGAQTTLPLRLLDLHRLRQSPEALRANWDALAAAGAVVLDGLDRDDFDRAARLMLSLHEDDAPVFAMGSQGLAAALARVMQPATPRGGTTLDTAAGRAGVPRLLVLSGSASPQSAAQIRLAEAAGWLALRIDLPALLAGPEAETARLTEAIAAGFATAPGVIAYTALGPADPAIVAARAAAQRLGLQEAALAPRTGQLMAALVRALRARLDVPRLVLTGGDTSSLTLRGLGADALQLLTRSPTAGARIARLLAQHPAIDGLQIILKAGQAGSEDLYPRALAGGSDWA